MTRLTWKSYASSSTIHTCGDIFTAPNKVLCAFWILILVTAISMASFEFSASVSEYQKRPLGISVTPVIYSQLKLPDVMLCPFGRFNKTYLDSHNLEDDFVDYIEQAFGGVSPDFYGFQPHLPNAEDIAKKVQYEIELAKTLQEMNLTFAQFIDQASISCAGIVDYCRTPFGRYDCCNNSEYQLTMSGKCHRLKGTFQEGGGFGMGMTIRLNLPIDVYYHSANIIHDQGIVGFLMDSESQKRGTPFAVKRGVHAIVTVKLMEYRFINSDQYRCKVITDENKHYDNTACFDQCIYSTAFEKCNCTTIVIDPKTTTPCTPAEVEGCINDVLTEEYNADNSMISKCRLKCPTSCSYKEFEKTVTYADFPAPTIRAIMPDIELNSLQNTIILDLFYEKLEVIQYSHYITMTALGFISIMGGQLNLWIGASIVSAIQLVIFLGQKLVKISVKKYRSHHDTTL